MPTINVRLTDVAHRFAFIEVATKTDTLELTAALGGTSFGSTTVVIRLEDSSDNSVGSIAGWRRP